MTTANRAAAGVLYLFAPSPDVAALCMSGSSLLVGIYGPVPKRAKPEGIRRPCAIASPLVLTPGRVAS